MEQLSLLIDKLSLSKDNPIRVRQIISQLSYNDLAYSGLIPQLASITPSTENKRYPSWVYRLNREGYNQIYADFGRFIEEIIWTFINKLPFNITELWKRVSDIPVPVQDLEKSKNFFVSIGSTFGSSFNGRKITHGHELTFKNVQGHPDLFNEDEGWILDIKTTGNFSKMSEESFLQILSYCALARSCNYKINFIGILLSLQKQILWYDVSNWDAGLFMKTLLRDANWVPDDMDIYNPFSILSDGVVLAPNVVGSLGRILQSDILGSHIRKEDVMNGNIPNFPIQIFLSNPQAKGFVPAADIEYMSHQLNSDTVLFIHAPYIINLCSEDTWPVERLRHELLASQQLGSRGVVVHVGKYKDQNIDQALDKMEISIRKVLDIATENCPLIIETPAGQGTELCTTLSSLQKFYNRFKGCNNIKICIDSAHIFSAGYDPSYYLKCWLKKFPGAIALVHFNDSRKPRGCHVDEHEIPGLGFIGYKRLWKVHELCKENNIPMIQE